MIYNTDLSLLVILSLANWRVSSLVAREEGPFNLLGKLRSKIGVRYDEKNEAYGSNWISKGILCVWCNSLWFSLLTATLAANTFIEYIVWWLAIGAMSVVIDNIASK